MTTGKKSPIELTNGVRYCPADLSKRQLYGLDTVPTLGTKVFDQLLGSLYLELCVNLCELSGLALQAKSIINIFLH